MKLNLKRTPNLLGFAVVVTLCAIFAGCQSEQSSVSKTESHTTHDNIVDSVRIEVLKLNDTAVWIVQHHDVGHGNMDSLLYAVDLMSRACQIDPQNSMMYAVRAQLLGKLGRYEEAARSSARACSLSPEVPEYFMGFGAATELSGDKPLAMQIYRHALSLFDKRYGPNNNTLKIIDRVFILMLLEEQFDMNEIFGQIDGYDVNNKKSIPVLTQRMFDTITRPTIVNMVFR